ncbi:hypothetical protein BDW02DRAFT_567876 [Decorospora gaudefroyi]|uniref:Uncharacterized protein n=1 Tax=Decorospora gaudefroyi TaxID=184978 RepID=A0A6A5KHD7_9PLEO|nr:hypothetical protein BDW02DRAFT_567876 [Decorospora gaudefroyi]
MSPKGPTSLVPYELPSASTYLPLRDPSKRTAAKNIHTSRLPRAPTPHPKRVQAQS